MAFKITVSPKVDWDIEDALDYYGEFSEKAKKSFKTQLFDCYKKLRKNPWFQKNMEMFGRYRLKNTHIWFYSK